MEEPPSTQPFGASSLRAGNIATEQLVDGCQEPPFRQFGASLFAQDSVSTSDRVSASLCLSCPAMRGTHFIFLSEA